MVKKKGGKAKVGGEALFCSCQEQKKNKDKGVNFVLVLRKHSVESCKEKGDSWFCFREEKKVKVAIVR